ncbi:hypothetical protein BOX15_Mlig012299g1 [Macrostomum lignano]|uniref:Uncharacterized protein n=2 Tax=Macrostomum lignano TaxID=282301 RepID=A0A267GVC8_9PLAT|nr:hypothetical protein BOX15_Mlig012299g3 [Macrostomum lignano]PAA89424.1 hypothetical protein BOX15_Mlig012299g1 [Macrostomum lignano]
MLMLKAACLLLLAAVGSVHGQCGCTPNAPLSYEDLKEGPIGDMILTTEQKLGMLGLRNAQTNIWPRRTLVYSIGSHMSSNANTIVAALRYIEQMTNYCVSFKQRTNEYSYVYVTNGAGCSSYVGYLNRGRQNLSLDNGCFTRGTIVHEFMHALGFHHEQTRTDRDSYLIIDWANILTAYCSAYYKYRGNVFGTSYDYKSCMQYPSTGFACRPGVHVMRRRDNGGTDLGDYYNMSANDAYRIRKAYGCA